MRTDLRLIARDPVAFEQFYRQHVDEVLRFVARRVGDPHTAADLTADIFVAVIDSAESYSPDRGTPAAWLYGVARNTVAGERRRAARAAGGAERVHGRRLLAADDITRLEERLDAATDARQLHRAMAGLSEAERAVLELVALDGLAVQQAAKVLGIRPSAARVRLHRARHKLRDGCSPRAVLDPLPAPRPARLMQEDMA